MDKKTYGLPNALPIGLLEPLEHMDLVMAKIEYDAHLEHQGIENMKRHSKHK